MKRFKAFRKKTSKTIAPDRNDTGQPGTGVTSDVTHMSLGDEYIHELHGQGRIDDIGRHHSAMKDHAHTKRGSAAKEYHSLQRDRASRLKGIMTGRISGTGIAHNKEYNKQDREKARAIKAKIKSSDYRVEDLDQADTIGDSGTEPGKSNAPKSARKLQKQSDERVKQKQKLAADEANGKT